MILNYEILIDYAYVEDFEMIVSQFDSQVIRATKGPIIIL